MKKIILFLVVVGLAFLGWKFYSSQSNPAVPLTNTAEPAVEATNVAETSVQVLPAKE